MRVYYLENCTVRFGKEAWCGQQLPWDRAGLSSRRQLWSAGHSRILECRVVEAMGQLLCDAGVLGHGMGLETALLGRGATGGESEVQ